MRIDWTQTRLQITVTGRSMWQHGQTMGWRSVTVDHDIWFVFSGKGELLGRNNQRHPLRAGTCLWITPGFIYEGRQDPDDPVGNYYIHFDLFDLDGSRRPYDQPAMPEWIEPWDVTVTEALFRRITEMIPFYGMELGQRFDPVNIQIAETLLKGLLMELDHACDLQDKQSPSGTLKHHQDITMRAVALLQEQAMPLMSVAELAETIGYSPEHFSRIFRQIIGHPPEQFIIRMRIERARHLLRDSALGIGEIAQSLGYSKASFFSSQFRQYTGMSPRGYRQRHGSQATSRKTSDRSKPS